MLTKGYDKNKMMSQCKVKF